MVNIGGKNEQKQKLEEPRKKGAFPHPLLCCRVSDLCRGWRWFGSQRGNALRGREYLADPKDDGNLYDVSVPAINQHLKRIFADNELTREATVKQYLIVQTEGNREVRREVEHYSLQAIISVGLSPWGQYT